MTTSRPALRSIAVAVLLCAQAAARPGQAGDAPEAVELGAGAACAQSLGLIAWAEDIKKASNGTITFSFFPGRAARQGLSTTTTMARDGIADAACRSTRLPAGPLPDLRRRLAAFQVANAGAAAPHGRLVPRPCRQAR